MVRGIAPVGQGVEIANELRESWLTPFVAGSDNPHFDIGATAHAATNRVGPTFPFERADTVV